MREALPGRPVVHCMLPSLLRVARKLVLRGLLIAVLGPGAQAAAQTLYVDDDAPVSCPCRAPSGNDDPACGQTARPFSCIRDAVATKLPFDTIEVRDGTYGECVALERGGASDTQRRTIRAEHIHGALLDCPTGQSAALYIRTNFVTVQGLRITGGSTGIRIMGADAGRGDAGSGLVDPDAASRGE